MARISIAADIHCGISNKLDDCLWALRTIREHAAHNDIEVVVILGDLFHDRVNLNIKVISEVANFLDQTKYDYNQDWLIFPGNHDMFMRHSWNVTSLMPIRRLITLINDYGLVKIFGRRFRIVPFVQNENTYMRIINHINQKTEDGDILLTHIGVSGAEYNSCFLMKHWNAVDFSEFKFSKVFAGHFHCNQQFENVYIPGSPIPFRFDEGMVEHGFLVYDLDSDDVEFVNIKVGEKLLGSPAPPDFVTITEDDVDKTAPDNCNVRIILDSAKSRDELDLIRRTLEEKGARKISWMKAKEADDSAPKESAVLEPYNLFERYIEHDKPNDLNKNLLVSLNKKIVEEAFDIKSGDDE